MSIYDMETVIANDFNTNNLDFIQYFWHVCINIACCNFIQTKMEMGQKYKKKNIIKTTKKKKSK